MDMIGRAMQVHLRTDERSGYGHPVYFLPQKCKPFTTATVMESKVLKLYAAEPHIGREEDFQLDA